MVILMGLVVVWLCGCMHVCLHVHVYIYIYIYISATVPSGTIVECSKALVGYWDSWDPGIVVLEIPKGFLRGQEPNRSDSPGAHRGPFFR